MIHFRMMAVAAAACLVSAPAVCQPVTVFARLHVTAGREAEAQARMEKLVAYVVEREPDVVYRFYTARSNPQTILTYEVYPSREAVQRHLKEILPAAQAALGPTPEGLYAQPQEMEIAIPLAQ